jgi:isochorismate synthase
VSLTPQVGDVLEGALASCLDEAANRRERTVVTVSIPYGIEDPVAAAFASRRADDSWFCWEELQTDVRIGALGEAKAVISRGPERFSQVAVECARISGGAVRGEPLGTPPHPGPLWLGGFAFEDEGGLGPWAGYPPARLYLPEVALFSSGGESWLTVNLDSQIGSDRDVLLDRALRRVASIEIGTVLPMLDPSPVVERITQGSGTPGGFEEAIREAVRRIQAGQLEKVVLARELVVEAASRYDPAAVFGALREGFPTCFNFCVGTPGTAFLGASPELLVRSEGHEVSTVGLAGSTRRSSDPAVDDHLAQRLLGSDKDRQEHGVVVRQLVDTLRPLSVWVEAAPEPGIVKVANIQHLGTPVVAHLGERRTAVELAGMLHPTPAVGGQPWPVARQLIGEVEGLDRGWYAGPVGWMDGSGDGEFCVALRSALLRDREARLYAGVGVVSDSDAADELAETEMKLGALLPLVTDQG